MRKLILAALVAAFLYPALPARAGDVNICALNVQNANCAPEMTPSGVSTTAESGHIIKASQGVLIGLQLNNWDTSAGKTVMLLDATAVPSNGTIATCTGLQSQTSPCIIKWYGVPAAPSAAQPATVGATWQPGPFVHFLNGLVAVCSSTGPTTLTLSAQCTFSAEIQ